MDAIRNLFFRLVIPTLIFSTIFFIPKFFFHNNDFGLASYFFHVWGGISYWFTSALAVAQLILLSLVFLLKKTRIWMYLGMTAMVFVMGTILNHFRTSTEPAAFFPWFYQTALEYTLVMTIGGMYMQYEEKIDNVLNRYLYVILITYVGILLMTGICDIKLRMIGLTGDWNLFGMIAIVCGIILLVALCKRMRPNKMLSYIGKNSIVFYFLSGVIPAMLGAIANQLFAAQSYGITLIITTVGVTCGLMATYVIKRYLPFMVDLRVLFKK